MRKGSVKKLLVGLFASVCMACSFLSLGVMVPKASASGSDFEILGASVRTADPDGIRFIAQIDTETMLGYGEAKYGMMLVPEDMEDGAGMTVTYDGTTYTPSNPNAIVIEGGEFWSEDLREANGISIENSAFSCALMAGQGDGEEVVSFPAEFYNRPITAVGFIMPENASTVYTEKVTRSIAYVATVESLKEGYEENAVVEKIVRGATATVSVNGNNRIDNYEDVVAPTLMIGGMESTSALNVTYTSNDENVIKIVDGKVQAVGEGRTTLTAAITAGGSSKVVATAEVTVALATYEIEATAGTGGSVSGAGTYKRGSQVTLTATADTGYAFDGWYEGNTKVSGNKTYSFTAMADKALTAKFTKNTYTVKLTAGTGGSVSGAGTYEHGASVTIKATPSTGYNFTKWSDGNTSASRTITVTSAVDLTATFTAKTFTITATAATTGGSVSGGGTYSYGSTATLKATTTSGYTFLGWYDSSDKKIETATTYSFKVTNAVTYKAKWKAGALSTEEQTWRAKQGYNYFYYTQLGTDVMPIGAWSSPPPGGISSEYPTDQITVANYQTLKESGINAIYGLNDIWWSNENWGNGTERALKCAEETGMVYIVRDGHAYGALSEKGSAAWDQFAWYMSSPAYGGTLFVDEPGYEQFDEIGAAMDEWYANEVYGDNKLALVNNLPNYASAAQLYYGIATNETTAPIDYTGENFENWVRAYLEMTQASVYSYDFYPYTQYGTNYMADENGYGYFDNISAVRRVCMEKNVPFWTFNQAGSAFGNTRTLTYAETAMQVNLSLAYGAKGIQWFNYWQPLDFGSDADDICGLVDHNGNKTVYYNYVQKINSQVAAVDSFLMKAKSTGIVEIGTSILGAVPSADKVTKYGAMTSATGEGNAIIGCFEYRNDGYLYYVASSDFTDDAAVTLNFNGTYAIQKVQEAASHYYKTNSITVHVPAGEGVLLYVPKATTSATTYKMTLVNDNTSAGSVFGVGDYAANSIVTLVAKPKPGYTFRGWWSGGNVQSVSPVYHFEANAAKTLTAYWDEDNKPKLLNDCEQSEGWVINQWGGGLPTSTAHATQGTYSAQMSGVALVRLGEHALTLEELKSAYKVIRLHIYLDSTANTTLMLGNWAKAYKDLTPGSNYVLIKTADLTSDHYFVQKGSGYLYLTTPEITCYIDNVVGYRSTALINDSETIDGFQTGIAPTLSTTNKTQGNYSVAVTNTVGGWWLNLRVAEASCSLAEFQATYSAITFHVYSSFAGEVIGENQNTLWLYDLSTGAWGANLAIFTNGTLHTVVIDTSQLTSSTYTTDAWGSYICMSVGGASTLWIDNVLGVVR